LARGTDLASQTVHNACGTLALLHVLLNSEGVKIGPTLTEFRDFAQEIPDAEARGDILGMSEAINKAHNSFAPPEGFLSVHEPDDKKGEAFHFVAYVPKNGALYELDGLQPGAIRLGAVPEEASHDEASASTSPRSTGWMEAASRAVQERMSRYGSSGEIRFTLLAVVDSHLSRVQKCLAAVVPRLAAVTAAMSRGTGATARAALNPAVSHSVELPTRPEELATLHAELTRELEELNAKRHREMETRTAWAKENARRRHNWIPLCVALLEECIRAGAIDGMVEKARERRKELREAAKARKAQSDDE
jgi:ubiquitin carboxyl-terminal hydrolase L5